MSFDHSQNIAGLIIRSFSLSRVAGGAGARFSNFSANQNAVLTKKVISDWHRLLK
jgi:hypothetical protein